MCQAVCELDCPVALGCPALCTTSPTEAPAEGSATPCRETAAEFEYGAERPADAMGNHHREMVWRDPTLEVTTGTALWYSTGTKPLPIRWVLTRDPEGKLEPRAYFSTNQVQCAAEIVEDFVKRWPIEVTYEESRAHLGVETQRQWSDLAIERSTPALLGLYSLVTLLGHALHPDGIIPIQQAAWYPKTQATFSDVLATVRRHLWGGLTFQTSATDPDVCLVPHTYLARLVQAASY